MGGHRLHRLRGLQFSEVRVGLVLRAAGPRFGGIGLLGQEECRLSAGAIPFFRSRLFFARVFFRPEVNMRFVGGLESQFALVATLRSFVRLDLGRGIRVLSFPFYGSTTGRMGFGNNLIPEMYESPGYVYGGDSRD